MTHDAKDSEDKDHLTLQLTICDWFVVKIDETANKSLSICHIKNFDNI